MQQTESRHILTTTCLRRVLKKNSTVDLILIDRYQILYFKRGSVQPGCILGGVRFRSTAVRFFKFAWCFRKIGKPYFPRETAETRLDLKSLKRQTKAEERFSAVSGAKPALKNNTQI